MICPRCGRSYTVQQATELDFICDGPGCNGKLWGIKSDESNSDNEFELWWIEATESPGESRITVSNAVRQGVYSQVKALCRAAWNARNGTGRKQQ